LKGDIEAAKLFEHDSDAGIREVAGRLRRAAEKNLLHVEAGNWKTVLAGFNTKRRGAEDALWRLYQHERRTRGEGEQVESPLFLSGGILRDFVSGLRSRAAAMRGHRKARSGSLRAELQKIIGWRKRPVDKLVSVLK